jgi:hypothetical protein
MLTIVILSLLSVSGILVWRIRAAGRRNTGSAALQDKDIAPDPEHPAGPDFALVMHSIKSSRIDLYEQLLDTWTDGPKHFDWVTGNDLHTHHQPLAKAA